MSTPKSRRWLLLAIFLIGLPLIGFAAFQYAIHTLRTQVEKALGPQSEVREIKVGLNGVEILGLRIKAPPREEGGKKPLAWPAEDQLRAERILIVPSLTDLFSAKVVLNTIRVENAYLATLRTRDAQIKVLPSLLDKPEEKPAAQEKTASGKTEAPVQIHIGRIELDNAAIEFFDATVRNPPHRLRGEQIKISLEKLQLPELKGQSKLSVDGILKGVKQDGRLAISGDVEFATLESAVTTQLRGVDMLVLQPYLLKTAETSVSKGTLDFELKSAIRQGQLRAPGTLSLKDLELGSGSGTLMGLPRNAIIALMKNRKGVISIKFVLEGNVNDPHFSLNENLATRIGSSFASTLDISVEGLARGVSDVGSGTAKGVGKTVKKLFKK